MEYRDPWDGLQNKVVSSTSSYVHGRFTSGFWGFVDDLGLKVTCNAGKAQVEMQGQLRCE